MNEEDFITLTRISDRRIGSIDTTFIRHIYDSIEWKSRLIMLKGCRGVGKTYMMLQHLRKTSSKAMYLSLDHLFFLTNTLSDTVEYLYDNGIRLIALDEVHKYPSWSIELKNCYDSYPDLSIVLTSSSALNVMAGEGDLSRRLDIYNMRGLTFLEYLDLEGAGKLPSYSFTEMLELHEKIYENYFEKYEIEKRFKSYLKKGYYPFYREAGTKYHDKLLAVILQVIDSDMAAIFNIDYESARQIKKLLSLITRIGPFTPNVSKLARDLGMSRNSVLTYFDYLSEAGIIHILKSAAKSDSAMTKPDKVYLENTNLLYAFDTSLINTGTIRETFVMNVLSNATYAITTPIKGDFLVNNEYVAEVGGPSKDFHQLQGMPNGVLIKEGIALGSKNVLPMWMLGLLK